VIPPEVALSYGLSGANLRGSGIDWDLRRDQQLPMAWDKCDWKVWTHPDGDVFARVWVRLQETREATEDRRPAARHPAQRADHGQGAPHHQGARGRGLGVDREPARRDGLLRRVPGRHRAVPSEDPHPSFNNISIASWVLRGVYVPDVIAILASLYFILGDIDR
jgi:NADH-quinone oxidoreductase subunit D